MPKPPRLWGGAAEVFLFIEVSVGMRCLASIHHEIKFAMGESH